MPFKIQGTVNTSTLGSISYAGTKDDAKENLASLRKQLQNADGTIKWGVLKLVNVEGGYEFRRTQWYHFGSRSTAKMEETAAFVTALISKAYPGVEDPPSSEETTEESIRKAFIPIMEKQLATRLTTYLAPNHRRAGTQGLMKLLVTSGLEIQKMEITSREQMKVLQDMGMGFHENKNSNDFEKKEIKAFLKDCGVGITDDPFGRGGFGEVYSATLEGDVGGSNYVFKYELETDERPRLNCSLMDLTQRGDLAATKVNALRHMTKPIFVVLKVTVAGESTYHYVPAGKAEEFKVALLITSPKARFSTVAQLMARAPGEDLSKILKENASFLEVGSDYFKKVATTLCKFFQSAWADNYCHFDIKPENIVLDTPRNGECTLLDGGLARQSKKAFVAYNHGTLPYMHPFLYKEGHDREPTHGSEVDAYSIAMTLLEIAVPQDFKKFNDKIMSTVGRDEQHKLIFPKKHPLFGDDPPLKYLDRYLEFLSPESETSETARVLGTNRELKDLLQQCFEVSGYHTAGDERDTAFVKWKAAFTAYAQP